MKSKKVWKYIGIGYIISSLVFHILEFYSIGLVILTALGMANYSLIYLGLRAAFDESNTVFIICFCLLFAIIIAYIVSLILVCKNKYIFFIIPLAVFISDIYLFVSSLYLSPIMTVGLVYKIIGCFVFLMAILPRRKRIQEQTAELPASSDL